MYRGRLDLSRAPVSPDDLLKVVESVLAQLGVSVPMSLKQIHTMIGSRFRKFAHSESGSDYDIEAGMGELSHDPVVVYLMAYGNLLHVKETLETEPREAFNALATAAMALVHGTSLLPFMSVAAGGKAAAAKNPAHAMKPAIRAEWEEWQNDRSKYRWPRDFRRAMMLKFPDAVDGTLKNWMSEWGRKR